MISGSFLYACYRKYLPHSYYSYYSYYIKLMAIALGCQLNCNSCFTYYYIEDSPLYPGGGLILVLI